VLIVVECKHKELAIFKVVRFFLKIKIS